MRKDKIGDRVHLILMKRNQIELNEITCYI